MTVAVRWYDTVSQGDVQGSNEHELLFQLGTAHNT